MKLPRPCHKCAFTVLELMIVLVIVAVLVAFLLPVLGSWRKAAASTGCLQNLRKIGHGMLQYAVDQDGWFPPHWGTRPGDTRYSLTWYGHVAPYLTTVNGDSSDALLPMDPLFFCPATPASSRTGKTYQSTSANGAQSYGYNYFLLTRNYAHQKVFRLRQLSRPQRIVLVADRPLPEEQRVPLPPVVSSFALYPGDASLAPRHPGKKANLVFADGHAESAEAVPLLTPGQNFKVGNWDPRY